MFHLLCPEQEIIIAQKGSKAALSATKNDKQKKRSPVELLFFVAPTGLEPVFKV